MGVRRFSTTVAVDAPAEVAWRVLADVAAWPTWTPTITRIDGDAQVCSGAVFRVSQPGMRPMDWTVTEFIDGESFTWTSRVTGTLLLASHAIRPVDGVRCEIALSFSMTSPFVALGWALAGSKIASLVGTEATSFASYLRHSD